MNLNQYKKFHFVGIGGVGMRALTYILLQRGYMVTGSDQEDDAVFAKFRNHGAVIYLGHDASHVDGADVVVVSTAIRPNNPEVVAAKEKGIPVMHRSDVLAAILNDGCGIAVAGAHGKTTTTSMLGQVFEEAGVDPTIVIGGEVDYLKGNSKAGKGPHVIAEADESDGSFLKLQPAFAVVTNIEDDHLDYYGSMERLEAAFVEFIHSLDEKQGRAILCIENKVIRKLLPQVKCAYVTYGFSPEATYSATDLAYVDGCLHFTLLKEQQRLGKVMLQVPGKYNVLNALATIATALAAGLSLPDIIAALGHFTGTKRRFQTLYRSANYWLVTDYAHHPTEIKATLAAAKEIGVKRVICVFQPHRYSRTDLLRNEFADAFHDADLTVFTDIYAAGEDPRDNVDGTLLPNMVKATGDEARYVQDIETIPEYLDTIRKPGDLIIMMGAGNINECSYLVKQRWEQQDETVGQN